MISYDIGVLVYKGASHVFGMLDVNAKDNSLGVSVCLLEKLSYSLGNFLVALLDDNLAVEVLLLENTFGQSFAAIIYGAFLSTVSVNVNVQLRANNLIRSKKAVLDSLFKGVGVNRLAEVGNV